MISNIALNIRLHIKTGSAIESRHSVLALFILIGSKAAANKGQGRLEYDITQIIQKYTHSQRARNAVQFLLMSSRM